MRGNLRRMSTSCEYCDSCTRSISCWLHNEHFKNTLQRKHEPARTNDSILSAVSYKYCKFLSLQFGFQRIHGRIERCQSFPIPGGFVLFVQRHSSSDVKLAGAQKFNSRRPGNWTNALFFAHQIHHLDKMTDYLKTKTKYVIIRRKTVHRPTRILLRKWKIALSSPILIKENTVVRAISQR